MKNNVLILTALCTAFASTSVYAHKEKHHHSAPAAEPVVAMNDHHRNFKVTLGGMLDFQAAGNSKADVLPGNGNNYINTSGNFTDSSKNKYSFATDALLHVKAEAQADNGIDYGAVVGVTTNTYQKSNTNAKLAKSYIFLKSGMGKLELGSNYSAASTMKVNAGSIARAAGGIDGDYIYHLNIMDDNTSAPQATYTYFNPWGSVGYPYLFLFRTGGLEDQNAKSGNAERPRKITYFTPMFAGFRAGVSFTPNTSVGTLTNSVGNLNQQGALQSWTTNNVGFGTASNVISGGISYHYQMDKVHLALSATGETGKGQTTFYANSASPANFNRLNTYEVGGSVKYAGFTLAGSYGSLQKSLLLSTKPSGDAAYRNSTYWDVGLAYEQGPIGASVTYFNSNYQNNKLTNLSFGADYKLMSGLMPYVEVNCVEMKAVTNPAATTYTKLKPTIYMVGAKVKF